MSEKVIDLEEVMERVQDDKELLLELFDIFTSDYSQKIKVLKSRIEEKDFEAIKELVHSIKGAAGNISAKAMHATCLGIEQAALRKDLNPVVSALPVLEGQFNDLQVSIAQIKKRFGG